MAYWIFTINPGSTSTKTALYCDTTCIYDSTVRHDAAALQKLLTLNDQLPLRLKAIEADLQLALEKGGLPDLSAIDAFVGRGGLLKPLVSGTYTITGDMLEDLKSCRYGIHASNLGAQIAKGLAALHQRPAYIVDPVTVDEMIPLARYSGVPQFKRLSRFHALNQKAIARKAAALLEQPYDAVNLIVAHLGGGISVAAHQKGRVIDVNNALEEGPFSPERAGTVPSLQLLDALESGAFSFSQMRSLLVGRGGLVAFAGTADAKALEEKAASDPAAAEIFSAMAFQISKSIGAQAAVLAGKISAIVLTGGLAYSPLLTRKIRDSVEFLAPVLVIPGENEMQAMAEGAYRVLTGEENALDYSKEA